MKQKILYIIGAIILLLSLTIGYLIFVKHPKTFDFKNDQLVKIELKIDDITIDVESEDFELFLEGLNKLKFKDKNTKVKTKGSHFVKLVYENEVYEIGRYYSKFNEKNKYTLFSKEFNDFIDVWFDHYNK